MRLRCEPGRCFPVGRRSPESLYDYGLATYDAADSFRHQDAEGFVRLWGLGVADLGGPPGRRQRRHDRAGRARSASHSFPSVCHTR